MKKGKRYVESAKLVDRTNLYDVEEAVSIIKKTANAKFDETIEAHIKLGVDDRLLVKQLRENRLIILKCETCSTIRLKTLHDHCDQRYNFIEHSHNQEWNQGK